MPPVDIPLRPCNPYYVASVFAIFAFIWILVVLLNRLYTSHVSFILVVPLFIFTIGFFNAECIDCELEGDVFKVTFITVGLLLSLPLLKFFNENNEDRQLNHVIFLAIISILISYYHVWVPHEDRHVCKAIQSCLETFAITLYIFAVLIIFLK